MIDNNLENIFYKYNQALKVLISKFNLLYQEYTYQEENPIEHFKYRIKDQNSIKEKLTNDGYEFTPENIERYVKDIVGVRIVCSFLKDIKTIINRIKQDKTLTIIEEKDYIHYPKTNGYSSYHLIVQFPINLNGKKIQTKAEIQIRTITMDLWASLDHKIRYKKNLQELNIEEEMNQNAYICNQIDQEVNQLILQRKPKESHFHPKIPKYLVDDLNEITILSQKILLEISPKINQLYQKNLQDDNTNSIEHIKSRIKSQERIISKLQKLNLPLTIENITTNINDLIGIRIVCSFKSDLIEIINQIRNIFNDNIIKEKDYITSPKESGYSSYHFLLQIPIKNQKKDLQNMKVEIQLRTIAMDMWASLEHKLCYQKEVDPIISSKLKDIAIQTTQIDHNMEQMIQISRQKRNQKIKSKKPVK